MTLSSHYTENKFGLSLELFPPKSAAGEDSLHVHVQQLMRFRPSYITCTYGAGGSTRDKTLHILSQVKSRFGVPVASHLTCVGATVEELRQYLREACQRGIEYIVALRGDPPQGQSSFRPVEGGLCYANELVQLIRAEFPQLGIAVAGYPETHREAVSSDADLTNLKRKADAGADVIITQLFFDNSDFFRFRDRCQKLGIHQPIIPGILPVTNLAQIQRIASLCGARIPEAFLSRLAEHDDEDWHFRVGVDFAVQQVEQLLDQNVPGLHFYVLNKSPATTAILEQLRLAAR